jgi:thiamine transport system ATP-binding protein
VTARLEVRGATVAFDGAPALEAVDLAVAPGEVVAVLGPSGSGKSTLLRAIAGLQPLDAGSVLLDGVAIDDRPPHRRGVGLMFQDHALFPHLDVAANVAFGLRMQGRTRRAAAAPVEALLDLVGLGGFGPRDVTTLSGGEQQRVALARALAPGPQVLLLDEPLGALDRPLRERLVGELRTLFEEIQLTVVAVTHDQAEAFALADRMAVLDGGQLVQVGPPAEVWAQPSSVRAARLLGFTNLAPVTVVGGRLHTAWGDLGPASGAVDAGAQVLLRPDGLAVAASGPIRGRVASATFAGAHLRLLVEVDGAPDLLAEVGPGSPPATGAEVALAVDPGAVVVLPA